VLGLELPVLPLVEPPGLVGIARHEGKEHDPDVVVDGEVLERDAVARLDGEPLTLEGQLRNEVFHLCKCLVFKYKDTKKEEKKRRGSVKN
jgi:hypothetical protein